MTSDHTDKRARTAIDAELGQQRVDDLDAKALALADALADALAAALVARRPHR